jgi:4'-phosphopantetheinyl transferase
MISYYYIWQNEELKQDEFEIYLRELPLNLQQKVLKYRRWQDRQNSLFGYLLIRYGMHQHGYPKSVFDNLQVASYGKPFISDGPFFNISHSGTMVAAGFSPDFEIGIDIEFREPINFDDFDNIYNEQEWQNVRNAEDSIDAFYHYWTYKESIIKLVGKGLSIPLTKVNISEGDLCYYEDKVFYLQKVFLEEGYSAAYATAIKTDFKVIVLKPDTLKSI